MEFELATRSFTVDLWYYHFRSLPRATPGAAGWGFSLDDLQLVATGDGHLGGTAMERDGMSGEAAISSGLHRIYEIAFDPAAPGTVVTKRHRARARSPRPR